MYQNILVAKHTYIKCNKSQVSGFRVITCKQTDIQVGRIFAAVLYKSATKEGRRRTSSIFLNTFQGIDKTFIHVREEEFRDSLWMCGRDTQSQFR